MIRFKTRLILSVLASAFEGAGLVVTGAMVKAEAVEWPTGPVLLMAAIVGFVKGWGEVKTWMALNPPKPEGDTE